MREIVIRLHVEDSAPELPVGDYSRITAASLADWVRAIGTGDHQPYIQPMTTEDITRAADGIAAREYRDTIAGIIEDLKDQIKAGDVTDSDDAREWLEQTIDGHHDVIYTSAAQEVCRQSRNDQAYFDDFGSEGAITDGGIEWSKLAYCAMLADVMEEIGDPDDLFSDENSDTE